MKYFTPERHLAMQDCSSDESIEENGDKRFLHSILLSNGWELRLPFQHVQMTTAQPVFPAQRNAVAARSA